MTDGETGWVFAAEDPGALGRDLRGRWRTVTGADGTDRLGRRSSGGSPATPTRRPPPASWRAPAASRDPTPCGSRSSSGFFLPVPAVSGGATEKIWYGLARKFAAAGHVVTFVSRGWPGLPARRRRTGSGRSDCAGFDYTGALRSTCCSTSSGACASRAHFLPGTSSICNTVSLPVLLGRCPAHGRERSPSWGGCPRAGRFYGGCDGYRAKPPSREADRRESPAGAPRTRVPTRSTGRSS